MHSRQKNMNTGWTTHSASQKADRAPSLYDQLLTYQKEILFVCLGFSGNYSEAEELTQEVYLKAWVKLNDLRDRRKAKSWLFKIARNLCIDNFRREKLRDTLDYVGETVDSRTPEKEVAKLEDVRQIKKIVQSLPRRLKQIFILREYGELSYQELTDVLNLKAGTVMSRLNRAKKLISKKVREHYHV